MQRALSVLVEGARRYHAQPNRYGEMAQVALQWHPSNFYQKRIRNEALAYGPHSRLWARVLLTLALDESLGAGALYVYGSDTYHLEELVHAAHIVILQQTNSAEVAAESAFAVAQVARLKSLWPFEWKALRTATATLAVADWAIKEELPVHTRYYSFAAEICEMIDAPPFTPNWQVEPDSPEERAALAKFHEWLERNRPQLEEASLKELPHLTDLASELSRRIRPPLSETRHGKK